MPSGKSNKPKRRNKQSSDKRTFLRLSRILFHAGLWSIAVGAFIVFAALWPVIRLELGYTVSQITSPKTMETPIEPVDKEFGIIIPKINANAKVVPQVDPFESNVYQRALTKGVAHAKGSAFPGDGRNTFLFSHSSVNFFDALRYNSVFYLLSKMEKGDIVYIYYRNIRYSYAVSDVRMIPPTAIEYLLHVPKTETVTLMTCWPPGTSYQRFVVIAERLP